MAKESFKDRINWTSAFHNLSKITGLELTLRNGKMYGHYYIDGSKHIRKDKFYARLGKDNIYIFEQGLDNGMSLAKWLMETGQCNSYREAYKHIFEQTNGYMPDIEKTPAIQLKYVPKERFEAGTSRIGIDKCNLYLGLCNYFPEEQVLSVFKKYNVCCWEDKTVFYYIDEQGNVMYDKIMLYDAETCKRDKKFGGGRYWKPDAGYYGRTLFGKHLVTPKTDRNKVCVLESEKSCILASLFFNDDRIWLATGGKNMLRPCDMEYGYKLYPDMDAINDWFEQSNCKTIVRWWKNDDGWVAGEKDDIGDYILFVINK